MQSPEEMEEALRKSNAPFADNRSADETALYSKQQADNRRMCTDRSQFERYKARLGDEAPKTFSAFRRIKKADAQNWKDLQKLYRSKFPTTVDKSGESGIIKKNTLETVEKDVHFIGNIDIDKYKNVTDKKILTDEVIITDNRIEHIIERRGQQFYDEFHDYFAEIIKDPDYIFKDDKTDTAVVSKTFVHKGKTVNIVLRLVVEGDDPNYKNSIITAIGENEKRFAQRLRNNTPVYRKFDKTE